MEPIKSKSKKSNVDDKVRLEDQTAKLMKTLGNGTSDEQRLQQLAKTYVELERDHNKQQTSLKQNEKLLEKELREKEHLQREYNKSVLIRDKLEQVCREQQKLMKSIKSESMTKIRDEEEKRKETQAHFQQSINEIFTTLGKNNDENLKIKEANVEMTKKFKYLAEQYELREKQLEKMNEQIKLETQLHDAKLAKVQMEAAIQKEILLKEKEAALEEILATKKAIVDMERRERLLKEQLTVYTEKYDQFQNSLQKSNDVFVAYKIEIEKMSKKTKLLDKEACEWRSKYEKSNRALLNMLAENQTQDDYVKKSARQLAQLQKLCRTLQAERGILLDVLKANCIERPTMPELPPEPKDIEPAPQPNDKLDMMSRNCKELKETLAQLQSQMNAITTEKSDKQKTGEMNAKKQKIKKNKPKKDSLNKTGNEQTVNGKLENVSINGNTTTLNDTASAATKEVKVTIDETVELGIESNATVSEVFKELETATVQTVEPMIESIDTVSKAPKELKIGTDECVGPVIESTVTASEAPKELEIATDESVGPVIESPVKNNNNQVEVAANAE